MHRPLASVLVIAAIVLITVLAALVATSPTGRYLDRPFPSSDGMPCNAQKPCLLGLACVQGHCQFQKEYFLYPSQLCKRDPQCMYGYACIEGRCQSPQV